MTRRSATNARYQKNSLPAGKTRKSASSAKASRTASSAPSKTSSAKKPSGNNAARQAYLSPSDPAYKRLRKLWWILLGVSFLLIVVSIIIQFVFDKQQISMIFSWTAMAVIIVVYYLDFRKIRPLRQAAFEAAKKGKPVTASGSTAKDKAKHGTTDDGPEDRS